MQVYVAKFGGGTSRLFDAFTYEEAMRIAFAYARRHRVALLTVNRH